MSIDLPSPLSRLTLELGAITFLNPNDFASLIRKSNPLTDRTSPPSPTSPIRTIESEINLSLMLEAMEAITERSAAGSFTFRPPTKLIN